MLHVELVLQGLVNGSMYAVVAIGLTLIYGLLRILHVAHAGLYTLGAYITVLTTNATGSLALGILAAMLVVGLCGMLVYRLLYEPMLERPPYVALIASIGLFICMEESYRIVFGPYGSSFDMPRLGERIALGPISIAAADAAMLVGAIVLLTGLAMLMRRTRFGVAWRATVTDPAMARSFGIDTIKVRYVNFFIASVFAAAAGSLVAVLNNLVEPTMGSVPSYKSLAIIVLGGLGQVGGTLAAALLLGVIEAYGTIYAGAYLDRDAIAFIFLIVVLMIRPQGLFARGS
ncbi:branched-chain amino acid ABC transporter permease [Xanthobacteraceae bacterium Astr-EGSB]|uniref:branched-chain amino acid ABC transporter permease n=1 Tax=Astrobacterium formosum TaxID=3069710 RepID=UPI0027B48BF5|nr:branched-chain amino acid ABC transporter permease [Xanthobacteraceae bacterium Astr-EGSB]